ncbi:MAG: hypothetical protein EA376_09265 [Phycisphaeraceae bacterium]|nr:MAG: hypothetical protein EA376_09265 [Phycisphaeraceae bacterium]
MMMFTKSRTSIIWIGIGLLSIAVVSGAAFLLLPYVSERAARQAMLNKMGPIELIAQGDPELAEVGLARLSITFREVSSDQAWIVLNYLFSHPEGLNFIATARGVVMRNAAAFEGPMVEVLCGGAEPGRTIRASMDNERVQILQEWLGQMRVEYAAALQSGGIDCDALWDVYQSIAPLQKQ